MSDSTAYRARVVGTYKGTPFEYSDAPGVEGSLYVQENGAPGMWWWAEGNGACACNRGKYVGEEIKDCGAEKPLIDYIVPLEFPGAPALVLNETGRLFSAETVDEPLTAVLNPRQELPPELASRPLGFPYYESPMAVVSFDEWIQLITSPA